VVPILNLCIDIEKIVAQIYQVLASRSSFGPSLRTSLEEMARDEEDHARIIQLARRLNPDQTIRRMNLTREKAQQLLEESRQLLASVREADWQDDYAVRTMLAVEDRMRQVHITCSTEFTERSMQQMFARLGKEEENHIASLRDFLQSIQ